MPTDPTTTTTPTPGAAAPEPSWLAALADAALRAARLTPEGVAAAHGLPESAVREILAGHAAPPPDVWAMLGDAVGADPATWNAARTSDADADALLGTFTRGMRLPEWNRWLHAHRAREPVARQASHAAPAPEPSTTGAPVVAFAPPAAVDPRYAECAANWRALRAALIDDLAGLPHEDLARLSWEVAKLARRGGAA